MGISSAKRGGISNYSNQILRIMQRSTVIGIVIVDQRIHQIVNANRAFCNMFGYKKKELVGKSMFDLTHPDDLEISYQHAMKIWNSAQGHSKLIKRYLKKDGGFIWVESDGFSLRDNDGNGVLTISFLKEAAGKNAFAHPSPKSRIDPEPLLNNKQAARLNVNKILTNEMNKRKLIYNQLMISYENEKKLRRRVQMEMKSRLEFTRIVVHDLKTPLTSIISSSGVLSNISAEGKCKELASNIYESTLNLNTRLDELLDLAQCEIRDPKINKSRFNIKEMVEHVVSSQQAVCDNDIAFNISIAPKLISIFADEDRLKQILGNLIDNAAKYSSESGVISIDISKKQNNILFSITDSGIGIKPEELKQIFKPYYRLENQQKRIQGLGLGLGIVKAFVKLHGGRVWVKSEYGKGATFLFTIPQALQKD